MEDQPADTGALIAGAVPQGKAARRHRLPRQKLRQDDGADADADVASDEGTVDEGVSGDEASPEADTVEPAVTAPTSRRRFPWRRQKPTPAVAAEPAEPEEPDDAVVEAATETTKLDADESDEAVDADTADAESDTIDADESTAEPEPETEPVLVPHRTAGRRLKVAAIAAGALFVGAAAFAGATLQPYVADRAVVHTKFVVAEVAANAITTLWTYTPEDMGTLPDRAQRYLGGDFADSYRQYIDSIVETNKQAQISNNTQVLGAAVESLTPTEATALVYTNSVATSPVTKGIPSLRYLAYRLTMERRGSQWLITRMTAVTSLDLTPRL